MVLTLQVSAAGPLGPPYNQPWQDLRPQELIESIELPSQAAWDDSIGEKIDDIKGYKSIRFGTRLEDLAERLRHKRTGNVIEKLRADGTYVVRKLYSGEETYGGLPVEVRVQFLSGQVSGLQIAFLTKEAAAFAAAFRIKYGAPNAGHNRWRGSKVEYWLDEGAQGGLWAKIVSLEVINELRSAREAETNRQKQQTLDNSKKLPPDF